MDISMSKKYQEELLNYYNMQKNKTPDNADEIPRPENESDEISDSSECLKKIRKT